MPRTKDELVRLFAHHEEKELVAKLLDKIKLLAKNGRPQVTDFLDPRLQGIAAQILAEFPQVEWQLEGGALGAERARVLLSEGALPEESDAATVNLLLLKRASAGKRPSHRDFLGAILGTGLKREKIGDLWVIPEGCVVAVAQEVSLYLKQQDIQVLGVPLEIEELKEYEPPSPQAKIISTTVSSLRLDAVAAAGYGASRSKVARDIAAGRIKVNWQETTKSDYLLKKGDVLSARGRGRVILAEVLGESKKGRHKIILERLQ